MTGLPGLETALTFQAIEHLQRGDIRGLEAPRAPAPGTGDPYRIPLHPRAAARPDIVQAAFLRAYERIGQLDPHRPFGPWFLTSVLHDAIKAAARRGRFESLERVLEVTSVEYNVAIPAALFSFSPPPGTAVSTFTGGSGADVKRALFEGSGERVVPSNKH